MISPRLCIWISKQSELKDSVIYWRLRVDATSNSGKFSLSNLANLYLVDVNKVLFLELQN